MRELLWRAVAWLVTRERVAQWLIRWAQRHPYAAITSRDGTDVYMWRGWVFNPYGKDAAGEITAPRWTWLPSIRVHHILRADDDDHMHDHPWNARTIVLRGRYMEDRPPAQGERVFIDEFGDPMPSMYLRERGYTGRVLFGQYHRISAVPPGGVWTLWFTWGKQGTWGFLVDGKKVPWREYLQDNPRP